MLKLDFKRKIDFVVRVNLASMAQIHDQAASLKLSHKLQKRSSYTFGETLTNLSANLESSTNQ